MIEPSRRATASPPASHSTARRRAATWGLASAVAVVVVAAVVAVALLGPRPTPPSECDVSAVTNHGISWKEIGGPRASFWFFSAEPDHFHATPYAWLITSRLDPDAAAGEQLEVWADHLPSGDRVAGSLNIDPRNIHRTPPPQLPGGWYPIEQRFPVPGCWRLSASIDGQVVGTAIVNVRVGTSAYLPAGTYMTSVAITSDPCLVFEIPRGMRYRGPSDPPVEVPAWWWDMGESGDCGTRTSDVVASRAMVVPREDSGYDLVLDIPVVTGETHEIRIALYVLGSLESLDALDGLAPIGGVVLSAGNASIFFTPLEAVEPTFAPRH